MAEAREVAGVSFLLGDCVSIPLADDSVDFVLCSPPYEDKRTYGMRFKHRGHEWLRWAMPRFVEQLRVCRGVVAWVVMGSNLYDASPIPAMLQVALHSAGYALRPELVYRRYSVPGSGGRDWFRRDHEWVVCATKTPGRLPWSEPTAMGKPPKYGVGGMLSNRTKDGRRANARRGYVDWKAGERVTRRHADNGRENHYRNPAVANPGSVIDCGAVGGGRMGHPLAHENEAPFPLKLAEFLVRSLCPPGGVVFDGFSGSGTTGHAALLHGRRAILMDKRESQINLAMRRIEDVRAAMAPEGAA